MNKNSNIFTIVLGSAIVVAVVMIIYGGSKNKSGAPVAANDHSHMAANVSTAFLNGLVGKSVPAFSFADRDGRIY